MPWLPWTRRWSWALRRCYRERMLAAQTVMDIQFIHTPGHTGIPGNERADALAKEAVGL